MSNDSGSTVGGPADRREPADGSREATRRAVLATAGAGALALAGCTALGGSDGESADLPEDCPTTQDLGVDWPRELDRETVASFVETYENEYYREVVVEYEPSSQVDSYGLSADISDEPTETGDGYEVGLSGSGGVYTPTLNLGATTAEPPADADVVPVSAVEDGTLRRVLTDAAEKGDADHHVDRPGETVDRYIDLVTSLSAEFDAPTGRDESGTAYFDVDGTAVELTVAANSFHGDYWWGAQYYVDEHVVWRVENSENPKNGTLVECRPPE
jgi:hypothetical protein